MLFQQRWNKPEYSVRVMNGKIWRKLDKWMHAWIQRCEKFIKQTKKITRWSVVSMQCQHANDILFWCREQIQRVPHKCATSKSGTLTCKISADSFVTLKKECRSRNWRIWQVKSLWHDTSIPATCRKNDANVRLHLSLSFDSPVLKSKHYTYTIYSTLSLFLIMLPVFNI